MVVVVKLRVVRLRGCWQSVIEKAMNPKQKAVAEVVILRGVCSPILCVVRRCNATADAFAGAGKFSGTGCPLAWAMISLGLRLDGPTRMRQAR